MKFLQGNTIKSYFNLQPFVDFISARIQGVKSVLYPFLLRFAICACVVIFGIWGIKTVWHSLTNLDIFNVSPSTFSFNTPPWVTDRFSADIKKVAALNAQYGMFQNNLTQKIADVYGGVVLIKKVDSIQRIFPNKLYIKFTLRKPATIVKQGNRSYLVDDECVLLPKEYYTLPNPDYDSPPIQSNKLSKLPFYGYVWNDKGVQAGVGLVRFLKVNNIHNLFKIVAVDVSNVCKRRTTGKSDIILWTENNTQIKWGCSPLCNAPNELSDEEKLQNLLSIAKAEGTNLKQMEYVDVRFKKPLGKKWAKFNENDSDSIEE